jgi:TolA-binding protein
VLAEEAKAVKEAEKRTKEFEEMKTRLDSFERSEQSRKEHQTQLEDTIKEMITRIDSMISKMYQANPKTPSLPKELEDTFQSIVGKKDDNKEKKKD